MPSRVEAAVAACPFQQTVFIAPPWPQIYRNDAERQQSHSQATEAYSAYVAGYKRAAAIGGRRYELVELPRVSIARRQAVVLAQLRGAAPGMPEGTAVEDSVQVGQTAATNRLGPCPRLATIPPSLQPHLAGSRRAGG